MCATKEDIESLPTLWRETVESGGYVPYLIGIGAYANGVNVKELTEALKWEENYVGIERRYRPATQGN